MREKILKKTIIILLAAVLAVGLFAVWSKVNYWIRPASAIESINIRLMLQSGYKDIIVTDSAEIECIRNMAADVQNDLSTVVKIVDAEAWQEDAHIAICFNYSDGKHQDFCAHKDKAVFFIGLNGKDYYWKCVRMEHVNNNDLYDYFQEDFN